MTVNVDSTHQQSANWTWSTEHAPQQPYWIMDVPAITTAITIDTSYLHLNAKKSQQMTAYDSFNILHEPNVQIAKHMGFHSPMNSR